MPRLKSGTGTFSCTVHVFLRSMGLFWPLESVSDPVGHMLPRVYIRPPESLFLDFCWPIKVKFGLAKPPGAMSAPGGGMREGAISAPTGLCRPLWLCRLLEEGEGGAMWAPRGICRPVAMLAPGGGLGRGLWQPPGTVSATGAMSASRGSTLSTCTVVTGLITWQMM